MLMSPLAISPSSLSNTGSPKPTGTPDAIKLMRAPIESPARAQLVEKRLELEQLVWIGAEERVVVDVIEIDRAQLERTDLGEIAADLEAELLDEILARDRTRRDAHDGLARRRAAAAAIVADTVFLLIRVIGVPGPKAILDLRVVAAALVDVLDEQPDGRARRAPLEHARQDLDLIGLLPLRDVPRSARAPPIEILLDVAFRQRRGPAGSRRRRSPSPARGSRRRS